MSKLIIMLIGISYTWFILFKTVPGILLIPTVIGSFIIIIIGISKLISKA
jgi:hypothetical protein